jgi:hypothetical protein
MAEIQDQTKKSLQVITDTFMGSDGGISFIHVRFFLEEMAKQAEAGDEAALSILDILFKFNKLIEVANK